MKRHFVALSTLSLLLAAAPASAGVPQATPNCEPAGDPQLYIQFLSNTINTQMWRGKLCLKACKSEFGGCKKGVTAIRKCKEAAAKAQWKTAALSCQLFGNPKKMCADTSKINLKVEIDGWKIEFATDKASCEAAHEGCKDACNAP